MSKRPLLKTACAIVIMVLSCIAASAQYYFRGEVKDETQRPLSNVKMMLHSTGYLYYSGTYGGFGITSANRTDTATLTLEGYRTCTVVLDSRIENQFTLRLISPKGSQQQKRLISLTRGLKPGEKSTFSIGEETYSNLLENTFTETKRYPATDFAISTDKAAYSNIRRFLNMGSTVPHDAVRIEEMLNYFDLGHTDPSPGEVFSVESKLSECPWKSDNQLFFIKTSARKLDLAQLPPSNLVFLIDVSGSMEMPNRLPLLKSAFKLMVNNLRATDTVSIVIYGGSVGVWLNPTSGADKARIHQAIEELEPGGATAGESGIRTAYRVAKAHYLANGNNRVILATDGDFNVGQTSEEDLERLITQHRQLGIYLTCLGVGMGNYKDSKLEVLAKKGNGNFSYLDDEREAEKVLVKELTQTMYAVADDALLHVNFHEDKVKSYRLIGFDNKVTAMSDTSSVLEGGEIGSGHTQIAIFEVERVIDSTNPSNYFADIELTYKKPNDSIPLKYEKKVDCSVTPLIELPASYRFATGVALFGSILKESRFTKNAGFIDVQAIVQPVISQDDFLQREFIALLEKAKKIYTKGKPSRSRGGLRQ